MNTSYNRHLWLVVSNNPSILELTTTALRGAAGGNIRSSSVPRVLEVSFTEPESFELLGDVNQGEGVPEAIE